MNPSITLILLLFHFHPINLVLGQKDSIDAVKKPIRLRISTVPNQLNKVEVSWQYSQQDKGQLPTKHSIENDQNNDLISPQTFPLHNVKQINGRYVCYLGFNLPLYEIKEYQYFRINTYSKCNTTKKGSSASSDTDCKIKESSVPTRKWTITSDCSDNAYLNINSTNPNEWCCNSCPIGANCEGAVTQHSIVPKYGYWPVPWRKNTFIKCVSEDDCIGYKKQKEKQVQNCMSETIVVQNYTGNNSTLYGCRNGTNVTSTLCAVCAVGYIRENLVCKRCKFYTVRTKIIVFCGWLIGFIIVIFIWQLYRKKYKNHHAHKRHTEIIQDITVVISLLVSFGQISTSIPGVFHYITFPPEFLAMVEYLSFFNGNLFKILGIGCMLFSYEFSFCLMTLLPIIAVASGAMFREWSQNKLRKEMDHIFGEIRGRKVTDFMKEQQRKKVEEGLPLLFHICDRDHSGAIDAKEFSELLDEMEWEHNNRNNLDDHYSGLVIIGLKKLHGEEVTAGEAATLSEELFIKTVMSGEIDALLLEYQIKAKPKIKKATSSFRRNKSKNELEEKKESNDKPPSVVESLTGSEKFISFVVKNGSSFVAKRTLQMLLLTHVPVSRYVFQYFACHQIDNRWFLRSDYSIECFSDRWYRFLPVVLTVGILFTLALPIGVLYLLLMRRHQLYSVTVLKEIGFLYQDYRRGNEFWEVFNIIIMMVLTGLLIFIPVSARATVGTMVCVVMCCGLSYFQPHKRRIIFWLTQISFGISAQKYMVAMTLLTFKMEEDAQSSNIIGIILIAFDLIFLILTAAAIIFIIILLRQDVDQEDKEDKEDTSKEEKKKKKLNAIHPQESSIEIGLINDMGIMETRETIMDRAASQLLEQFTNNDQVLKRDVSTRRRKHTMVTQGRVLARKRIRTTKALHKVEAFADLPQATLDKMVDKMKYLKFNKGIELCLQGEIADQFFIIVTGQCSVMVQPKNKKHKVQRVNTLYALDFFGESALKENVVDRKRNATIISESTPTQVLALDKSEFDNLIASGDISQNVSSKLSTSGEHRSSCNLAMEDRLEGHEILSWSKVVHTKVTVFSSNRKGIENEVVGEK